MFWDCRRESIRAALFRYNPPFDFATKWCLDRTGNFRPETLSLPVAPIREFWIRALESKIRATIKNEGDLIGYEDDAETVGPRALAAKRSLLDAIPYIMPQEDMRGMLYRLVLEHGDYGIHNMTIAVDDERRPHVTSLFDWETGFIVPAIFSDPLVTV